jgi:hypothetical protein
MRWSDPFAEGRHHGGVGAEFRPDFDDRVGRDAESLCCGADRLGIRGLVKAVGLPLIGLSALRNENNHWIPISSLTSLITASVSGLVCTISAKFRSIRNKGTTASSVLALHPIRSIGRKAG